MAQQLDDDGVFWLPSEFLIDDDDDDLLLTAFYSDLTSPVTTDDDNHDFIAGLTHKIPNSTLNHYQYKEQKLSTSPQSTLYGCKTGSSRAGSPNSVSSPPDVNGLDFLYAAAEEVARMRIIEQQTSSFYSTPLNNPNHPSGFYPTQTHAPFSYQQHQVWAHENIGMRNGHGFWPSLQQSQHMGKRPGSGMTPGFLGKKGVRKERTGTGVFLPRRIETNPINNNVHRKQPGCSVLLPDKMVHALNLNIETEYGVGLKQRNDINMNNLRPVMKQELGLPQEWTY